MKKKVLVLTGSPRVNGNSDRLAEAFVKGAEESGHEVTVFHAGRKKIKGCIACDTCYSKGKACSFTDDFDELAPLLEETEMLVFVTPLYWFTFPAQIKAAIDKMYAFNKNEKGLNIKESLLIGCGETSDLADFDGLSIAFDRMCNYLQWENKGKFLVLDVNAKGDVLKTDALATAKEIGAALSYK